MSKTETLREIESTRADAQPLAEEETSDAAPVSAPESVVMEDVVQPAGSLEQFTYSVRHRTTRPFASGPYEGRIRLGTNEFIVSASTLDDVITQMTVKADSLLANGYKTQG